MASAPRTPTILVALDLSEDPDRVVEAAATLASGLGAEVTLIHVLDPNLDHTSEAARYRHPGGGANEEGSLIYWAHQLRDRGIPSTLKSIPGAPVATILQAARELEVDYLVLGVHDHGLLYEAMVGSVTREVLAAAPCPVLAVPPAREDTA